MAARLNRLHQESVRDKIRATQLVNALQNHVFSESKAKRLDSTQVTAALGLLKKCVPDISATELTGADGGPIQIIAKPEDAGSL